MGAWHAPRWSSRGVELVLELVLWPITMQPPHASEREGRDARGLSGARATKFNSSNIATWRVYNSVKHGSWLAGCESSCHSSKRYTLYLMLDRRRRRRRRGRRGRRDGRRFVLCRTDLLGVKRFEGCPLLARHPKLHFKTRSYWSETSPQAPTASSNNSSVLFVSLFPVTSTSPTLAARNCSNLSFL